MTPTPAPSREPLPCPFCGSENLELRDGCGVAFWLRCHRCVSEGPSQPTPELAVEKWNTRRAPLAPETPDET
jgi:Lar family restriction alleviation protein